MVERGPPNPLVEVRFLVGPHINTKTAPRKTELFCILIPLLLHLLKHFSLPCIRIVFLKLNLPLYFLAVLTAVIDEVRLGRLQLYEVVLRHMMATLAYPSSLRHPRRPQSLTFSPSTHSFSPQSAVHRFSW